MALLKMLEDALENAAKKKKAAEQAAAKQAEKKSSYTFTPKVGSANSSLSDIPKQQTQRSGAQQSKQTSQPQPKQRVTVTPSTVMGGFTGQARENTFAPAPQRSARQTVTPNTVMGRIAGTERQGVFTPASLRQSFTPSTARRTHGGRGGGYGGYGGVDAATRQDLSRFFNGYNAVIRSNLGARQKRATLQRLIGNHSDLFDRYERQTGRKFDIAEAGSVYGDINRQQEQQRRDRFFARRLTKELNTIPQAGTFYGDYIRKNGDYKRIAGDYIGKTAGRVKDFFDTIEIKDSPSGPNAGNAYYTPDGKIKFVNYKTRNNMKNSRLLYMTDEEKAIHAKLWYEQGEKAADDFLDRLGIELDKRRAQRLESYTADIANKHKFIGAGADIINSLGKFTGLPETVKQAYRQANSSYETYRPFNPYSAGFDTITQTRGIKEGITRDMSDFGKTATDLALNIGENAARIPLGPAGLYLMGAGVVPETAVNQGLRGETNASNALLTGVAYGAAEVATEKISLDSLMSILRAPKDEAVTGIKSILKTIARNAPKQAGYEASEEALSNIADNIADRIINGDRSEYEAYVRELKANGASDSEARKAAFLDKYVVDTIKDAAAGAVSGAIFGIGGSAASGAAQAVSNTTEIGRGLNAIGAQQSVINEGLARDAQTAANSYASKLQNKQNRGRELSDWNVGRQYIKNVRADESADNFVSAMSKNVTPVTEHDTLTDTINGREYSINGRLNRNGTIDTALDSSMSREATVKHEILHWLRRNMPDAYNSLENTVLTAARETNAEAVDSRINFLKEQYGYDDATAREEIVAELTGGISNRTMRRIAEGNSTLAERIAEGVSRVKRDIRSQFSSGRVTNAQGVEVAFGEYNRFEKQMLDMLKAAKSAQTETGDVPGNGEVKNSIVQKPNGDYKVIADRDIFNGVAEADRISTLKKFLNENIRGNLYTALSDGAPLNVAQKNQTFQKLYRPGISMNTGKYNARLETASHYDEVLEASKYDRTEAPKNNKHRQSLSDKRTVEIEIPEFDSNGKMTGSSVWEAEISVINNEDLAYDISKLRDITKNTHSDLRNLLKANPNIDRVSLPNIISQQNNFVKQNDYRNSVKEQITTPQFKEWFGDWLCLLFLGASVLSYFEASNTSS